MAYIVPKRQEIPKPVQCIDLEYREGAMHRRGWAGSKNGGMPLKETKMDEESYAGTR